MKRLLILLFLLLGSDATAQYSAQIQAALRNFPNPYAADPATCTATSRPRMYYNTVSNTILFCNGTTWLTLADTSASGTITIGTTTITGGTNTRVLFDDSGVVGEDAGFVYVKATDTLTVGALQVSGTIELANVDTTLARSAAGQLSVEGIDVLTQTNTLAGITNKTFVAPVLGAATGTSLAVGGALQVGSKITAVDGYLTGVTNNAALFAGFQGYNNQTAQFDLLIGGSAVGGTWSGVSANNLLVLNARGASLTGFVIQTGTSDPLTFGTNDTARLTFGATGNITFATHLVTSGTAPAITSCGTSPSVVTGNDISGEFTFGTGGTDTDCTLTFAVAYGSAPQCFANNESTIVILRTVTTTTTLVIDAALAASVDGDLIKYWCIE